MPTDTWNVKRRFSAWFCGLSSVGEHIGWPDDHGLSKFLFIFALYTSGICNMLTDNQTNEPAAFVRFVFGAVLIGSLASASIPSHVSLIVFLCVKFSRAEIYLQTL